MPSMPQTNNETTISTENSKNITKGEEHKKTWDALVYNKNIKSDEVLNVYKTWATAYQSDMDKVNPKKSEHVAQFAAELVKGDRKNPADLTVLDVAAGTGSVGVELVKYGFKNITATDYCQEMLDAAKEKGRIQCSGAGSSNIFGGAGSVFFVKNGSGSRLAKRCYKEFVCCKFGTVTPKVLYPRKFDVVVMHGGFAAGHIPLSSLHTMARLCKKGGIVINSMSLQYTHFVEEYMDIHSYIQELVEAGIWKVEFTRVLDNCMADRHALVHAFRIL